MAEITPLTDASRVIVALGADADELDQDALDRDIQDAAGIVRRRVRDRDLSAPRGRIETLVAAHLYQMDKDKESSGYGPISSVSRGGKSVSFETPGTNEQTSDYWRRAMMLTNDALGDPVNEEETWDFHTF